MNVPLEESVRECQPWNFNNHEYNWVTQELNLILATISFSSKICGSPSDCWVNSVADVKSHNTHKRKSQKTQNLQKYFHIYTHFQLWAKIPYLFRMFVRTSVRFSVEIAILKSVKICKIDRGDKAGSGPLVLGPGSHAMGWPRADHGDSGAVNICNITKHIASDNHGRHILTGCTQTRQDKKHILHPNIQLKSCKNVWCDVLEERRRISAAWQLLRYHLFVYFRWEGNKPSFLTWHQSQIQMTRLNWMFEHWCIHKQINHCHN